MRQEFDTLTEITTGNIDKLTISKTKLGESFPKGQFLSKGFCESYRLDRDCKDGGIMLLIRKDMPSKHLSIEKNSIEAFCVEINLRKTKWLL